MSCFFPFGPLKLFVYISLKDVVKVLVVFHVFLFCSYLCFFRFANRYATLIRHPDSSTTDTKAILLSQEVAVFTPPIPTLFPPVGHRPPATARPFARLEEPPSAAQFAEVALARATAIGGTSVDRVGASVGSDRNEKISALNVCCSTDLVRKGGLLLL